MRTDPLLVPIELRVLLLGGREQERPLADVAPHYERMDQDSLFGDDITNDGLVMESGLPGAHLHWLMPDALLRGEQNEAGDLEFPQLPNRWIVLRLWPEGDRIRRKAWMVQSDRISFGEEGRTTAEGMRKTSIPCLAYNEEKGIWEPAGEGGSYHAYLGGAEIYGEEQEPQRTLEQLTAVGMGDHLFSALYPLCRTVFGFYDPLEEAGEGVYTYQVCGFYQDPGKDPLTDPERAAETMREYGWSWSEEGIPDSTLCHGAVYGVRWKGKGERYIETGAVEAEVTVANTSAEALAACFQKKLPQAEGLERLLNALQSGLLDEFDDQDQTDGLIGLEDQLHERQFDLLRAGEDYGIRPADISGQNAAPGLSKQAYEEVRQIRETVRQRDRVKAERQSRGEVVYLYWHKYMKQKTSPFDSEGAEKYREKLEEQLCLWEQSKEEEEGLSRQLRKLEQEAAPLLEAEGAKLERVPQPVFYQPSPPVVLIADTGAVRTYRHGFQSGEDGTLACRRCPIDSLWIRLEKPVDVSGQDLEQRSEPLEKPLPKLVERLCRETILLSGDFTSFLAGIAAAKAGLSETEELEEVVGQIRRAQMQCQDGPDDLAFQAWKMPWNPLVLDWQAGLRPARANPDREDTSAYFQLGDIDLEPTAEFRGKEIRLGGRTLLTPHAPFVMGEALKKLAEGLEEGSGEYQEVCQFIRELKDRQILSQKLTGLDETLLGLKRTAFLPVLSGADEEDESLAVRVNQAVEDVYPVSGQGLDRSHYLSLRGGAFRLTSLGLIDEFGQYRQMVLPQTVIMGESMRWKDPQTALMPPRFPGGARVNFDWICEGQGFRGALDENSSPVSGFVRGNLLERELQIYDPEGEFLGWVQDSDTGVRWKRFPGTSGRKRELPETLLGRFVKAVLSWDRDRFEELLEWIDLFFSKKPVLGETPGSVRLAGGCFALAAAEYSVEGQGLPRYFWGGEEIAGNGYENAEFSLRLGDTRRDKDGLIGFFPIGEKGELGSFSFSGEKVPVTLRESGKKVLLLLEPCRRVTLLMGLLPACQFALAPEFYRKQMEKLRLCLDMWPVLEREGDTDPGRLVIQEKYILIDEKEGGEAFGRGNADEAF